MRSFTPLLLATAAVAAPVIERREAPSGVPSYVVDYAPAVYLYSEELYFPSDIGAQLTNTSPALNRTVIEPRPDVTLDNLAELNNVASSANGDNIYLTSNENVTNGDLPAWIYGVKPTASGLTTDATSCAIVVVPHSDNETVDAFYFYFYAYNWGGIVLGLPFDDHVGDWEHTMVRFVNETPQAVYYSQHSAGGAFTYDATEKYNTMRPITYSGNGSHANYPIAGTQDHTIPGLDVPISIGPLEDYTDKGYLWDPTLNAYYFSYDSQTSTFSAYGDAPTSWLYFNGAWGDEFNAQSPSPPQLCLFGVDALCHYTSGPTGPKDKSLVRTNVCPDSQKPCIVSPVLP